MRMPLQPGPYTVASAVVDERNVERADYFDWVDAALAFEVTRPLDRIFHAMFYVPQRLRVERGETTP